MHEAIAFWRMIRWPIIFVGLATLTHQAPASAAVVLLLAFRDDLSVVLRRRRVAVKLPGFEGEVGDPEADRPAERDPRGLPPGGS